MIYQIIDKLSTFGWFVWITNHPFLEAEPTSTATALFANTGVQVTSESRPYLGAAINTEEFVISYVKDRVANWTKELDSLATIALSQPHAAHATFTHGLSSMWSYLTRTINGIGPLLQPLETIIRSK